jgi:hypothetical protein
MNSNRPWNTCLGFGVWGLGFGFQVWGLGFGVWAHPYCEVANREAGSPSSRARRPATTLASTAGAPGQPGSSGPAAPRHPLNLRHIISPTRSCGSPAAFSVPLATPLIPHDSPDRCPWRDPACRVVQSGGRQIAVPWRRAYKSNSLAGAYPGG